MYHDPIHTFGDNQEATLTHPTMNGPGGRFQWAFDRRPALLCCVSFTSEDHAFHEMESALAADYQGVFLCFDRLDAPEPRRCLRRFGSTHRAAWIGARVSEATSSEDLNLVPGELQGLWLPSMTPDTAERIAHRVREEDCDCLLFGTLKLTDVDSDDVAASAVALSRFVDVLVTELPVSNPAQAGAQVRAIEHALGNFPLAIAGGCSSSSISDLTELADCLIVPAGRAPVARPARHGR